MAGSYTGMSETLVSSTRFRIGMPPWTFLNGQSAKFTSSGSPNREEQSKLSLSGQVSLLQPELSIDLEIEQMKLLPFAGYPGFGPGLTLVEGTVDLSGRVQSRAENWGDLASKAFFVGKAQMAQGRFHSPSLPVHTR